MRQATQPGSDWTSRFTGTDPNFTVLLTVGKIQFVIPNRLLVYPWPRNAPGILVPCPNQEQIYPHADGCLDVGRGSAVNLRIPMDDAPGDLSKHFVVDATLEFLPQANWKVSVLRDNLLNSKNQVVRRVPERDAAGYEAFQTMADAKILSAMSSSSIEEDRRTYTFVPVDNRIPNSINCTYNRPNDKLFFESICNALYPFSPSNSSWPPYPEYRIRYYFPGEDFPAADQVGSWLGDKLRSLMKRASKP